MEGGDSYAFISGNQLTVSMFVTEPGYWIRVITATSVPEPSTLLFLGSGLVGLIGFGRKKVRK